MRIIVTGGTGFIGRRLVARLMASDHSVTVLTRDVERAVRRLPALCEVASWKPPGALDPTLLRNADAVVHLAGELAPVFRGVAELAAAVVNDEIGRRFGLARDDEAVEPRLLEGRPPVAACFRLAEASRERAFGHRRVAVRPR